MYDVYKMNKILLTLFIVLTGYKNKMHNNLIFYSEIVYNINDQWSPNIYDVSYNYG